MDKATQQFILDHAGDNPARLMLQASRFPGIDMPFVIRQIAARQRIKAKIPTFYEHPDLEYPGSYRSNNRRRSRQPSTRPNLYPVLVWWI